MNGVRNGKNGNLDKPFPGCLGRMVNLFDLSTAVAGNKLLTDKPHRNDSPLSRSQSDVSETSPVRDHTEDEGIVSELRRTSSNTKSDGTPIKMLIAEEMVREGESKHIPSNLVAKLMGLDALPLNQPDCTSQRSHSTNYSRGQSQAPEFHHYSERNEYKDVYEVWPQQPKRHNIRGKSPQTANEKKMALVRQKFIEAKRLATDENLRQSKQFQEALEVLSSNKDLFLKFLQEPDSMFSQHLYNLQSTPQPNQTNRITVLRPSKIVNNSKFARLDKNNPRFSPPTVSCSPDESSTKPTRIVVLKPSLGKNHEVKAVVSQTSSPLRESYGDSAKESREVAKGITRQMCENLSGHDRRDETLLSSVFSNGYIGDESSFNKSEIEYAEGMLSDSEITSPTCRHSWDYDNRFCRNSPSSSSISRASYSPESSVCREAKKRLSERWAMVACKSGQEQRYMRRSSSTLGEMLALSNIKKSLNSEEESRGSTSRLISESNKENKDECEDTFHRNLHRSKSLPVSSTIDVPKVLIKTRSTKSSFKGKVSSLFFSKNRKLSKEKSEQSKDEMLVNLPGRIGECVNGAGLEEGSSANLRGFGKLFSPESEEGMLTQEAGFSITKSAMNPSDNQEQPSPISVLDSPFEENGHTETPSSSNINTDRHAVLLPAQSNLIDKSPPIGSISRTLSWDNSCAETASSYPSKPSLLVKDYEQECFFFVQTLLSESGLDDDVASPDSFLARWHSPESPLDPSLRDKYTNATKDKKDSMRLTRKLVFDCVNAALVDLAGCRSHSSIVMVDHVWDRIKEWFIWGVDDGGDNHSMVVERIVRNEVVGTCWAENLRLEKDNLQNEIEIGLLEKLLEEAVIEFTGKVH